MGYKGEDISEHKNESINIISVSNKCKCYGENKVIQEAIYCLACEWSTFSWNTRIGLSGEVTF